MIRRAGIESTPAADFHEGIQKTPYAAPLFVAASLFAVWVAEAPAKRCSTDKLYGLA